MQLHRKSGIRAYQASLTAEIPRSRGRKANLIPSIFRAFGRHPTASPWDTENSIREELFSIERLEEHAESLAATQHITARPMPRRSLALRLRDNEAVLLEAYRAIGSAAGERHTVTPAAEWLLDNFHVVLTALRDIHHDLPPAFFRRLPWIAADEFAAFAQAVRVPLLANMTEFGRSPNLDVATLGAMGYRLILFPVTAFRIALRAAQDTLADILKQGHQRERIPQMLTRAELYDLLGYADYEARDQAYFG